MHGPWAVLGVVGALCLAVLATQRGEPVNALWIVVAAISIYLVAYRYYSLYIAEHAMRLDPRRSTPAVRLNNGLDFVPTDRYVLFGHHFAAIAGAGPLVGPVLAAQMGYLPGTLWIIFGVVLAGAVQDFMILFVSMRRDGRSIGELIRSELGAIPGVIALFGTFMIMIIILAVMAMIVVKALTHSPWGTFTVAATIPIAMLMGVYSRYIRPGRIGEVSVIGFILLLLAPRDYLSTFLKIGTIAALALSIFILAPQLHLPAVTKFVDGSGPVWSGGLFPFLFITIACGAVSGFHALISSGTTPKMIDNETNARFIGYGGMLMESFVAIMALVSAAVLDPGVYFVMNSPAAVIGTTPESAAAAVTAMGFAITPETISQVASDVGEASIISRAGGAPTLAVGMAQIISSVFGDRSMMAFWYHFAILFEALFILTAIDAGTRAGRFMLQDLIGLVAPSFRTTSSWVPSIIATALCVTAWGTLLHQGVTDPLGGINTLWPLFGISNQMLAAVALTLATVVLFKMKRQRYAWITILPASWLVLCTLTAGLQKIFSTDVKVGFVAAARQFSDRIASGDTSGPLTEAQMQQIVQNNYINTGLTIIFVVVVVSIVGFGINSCIKALRNPDWTAREAPDSTLATPAPGE